MAKKILQINLRFNVSAEDLAKEFESAAVPIAKVPGLKWKIFGLDRERSEACGIYLFEDSASLKAYIEGPIMARMKSLDAFSEITMKQFDCVEEASAITRGPV
ncbi:MAG: YdhR family protein [Bacillota bacterium]|nr:YdhR family protein [Bacillota bacterium]